MASPSTGAEAGAASLLKREARSERARLIPPVLLGLGIAACGVAQAFLLARLLATLLGQGDAGWAELTAAAALALLMAALGIAQERAQLAAGEDAKARLRAAAFARLLAAGPADDRAVGEKSALVVERIEALEGYFARWLPAAMLAVLAPLMIGAVALVADPLSVSTNLRRADSLSVVDAPNSLPHFERTGTRVAFRASTLTSGRWPPVASPSPVTAGPPRPGSAPSPRPSPRPGRRTAPRLARGRLGSFRR